MPSPISRGIGHLKHVFIVKENVDNKNYGWESQLGSNLDSRICLTKKHFVLIHGK